MNAHDRHELMCEFRVSVLRDRAHRLNPIIHPVDPQETFGTVSEILHETVFAIWEALDRENAGVETLRDLLFVHRHGLQAAAAAIDFENADISIRRAAKTPEEKGCRSCDQPGFAEERAAKKHKGVA